MKDKRSLHLKIQEMADCYKEADYLKEMSIISQEADEKDESALKWIALAVFHGVNANAEEISLQRARDGTVEVWATYRESRLPAPAEEVGRGVIDAMREILHIEGEEKEIPLTFGWGNEQLNLKVRFEGKDGKETITLKFPESLNGTRSERTSPSASSPVVNIRTC